MGLDLIKTKPQSLLYNDYQLHAPHQRLFFHIRKYNLGGCQSNVSMTNSTAAKRTGVSSWKHLIEVHLNFTFEYEKKSSRGACY